MANSLQFNITNKSGIDNTNVYIGFWGASLNASINNKPMTTYTWYALDTINSFIINTTTSGRFYIAYNDTFTPNGSNIPSIITSSSEAYLKRFDKFELTFDGTDSAVADLTSIDFWSIPMSLETSLKGVKNNKQLNGFKGTTTGHTIFTKLKALSSPAQSTETANNLVTAFNNANNALPQGIINDLTSPVSALVEDKSGNFVRIIGPNSYPPFGNPNNGTTGYPGLPFTPYNTFETYFDYLIDTFGPSKKSKELTTLGDGKIARLKGNFAGSTQGTTNAYKAQSYDVWTYIDNDGNLQIKGTTGIVGTIDLYVNKWDLLAPSSVYGGSPAYATTKGGSTTTPANDIYGWIFGDFFAGINIGAVGSATTIDKVVVGDMNSTEWFSTLPANAMLFDKLWPKGTTNYWNQWAQELNSLSDAYNFAYAERFSSPQISLAPTSADTLTLVLLPESITK